MVPTASGWLATPSWSIFRACPNLAPQYLCTLALPRERVEVFGGGAVGVIENFQAATFTRGGRKKRIRNWLSVDRGHRGEVEALLDAIRNGGPAPVDFEEYVYTTLATFGIEESLRRGVPMAVDPGVLHRIE